jgi:hypothetical protein
MFYNFYLVKNHKFYLIRQPLKLAKNKYKFEIFRILENFNVCLTKCQKYQIKISNWFTDL